MTSFPTDDGGPATDSPRSRRLGAAARVTALAGSLLDLHVRIALKEVDREKRRLIIGLVLLAAGLASLLTALVSAEIALLLWLVLVQGWTWVSAMLAFAAANLVISGVLLRLGGVYTKGPYLQETMAGLIKTTRALVGR